MPDFRRRPLLLLGLLFTISGCVGLLAEQCFEKLLSTLVGATTPAAATVLAVYFGGLTLGGLMYRPLLRPRVRSPLRAYGLLEAAVGLWALILFAGFDWLLPAWAPLLSLGRDHFALLQGLRLLISAVWILPLTIPMGATFPAVVDALAQYGAPQRAMVHLYALNLLGAILGALLGPFVTFPLAGVAGTLVLCALCDLLVALFALRLAEGVPPAAPAAEPSGAATPGRPPLLLIGIAALSGFLFFALEVVWTHLISTVLGNSVYAFGAVLAMVLVGLGLAGLIAGVLFRGRASLPLYVPGHALIIGAAVLMLMQGLWPRTPHLLATLGRDITGFYAAEALRYAVAALLLVPPATVLGLVYPSIYRLERFPVSEQGGAAGILVAANALGCIAGALLCSFVLIPGAGSEGTLRALALAAALCGLVLSGAPSAGAGVRLSALALCAVAAAGAVWHPRWDRLQLTSGEHVYFRPAFVRPDSRLRLFHEDTLGGITSVVQNPLSGALPGGPQFEQVLLTNGKFQGNDLGEVGAQVGLALIPMMFVPGFDDALVIGLGTGQSPHVIENMGFRQVDIADIAPGIVQAAREHFRAINGAVLEKPNVRLYLEDGRNLLLLRDRRYDLISMEISSVWWAGSTNLYSREFYRLAQRRLKEGGVLQQWIQFHHIGTEELLVAIATVRSVFSQVSVWLVGGQGVIVASDRTQAVQPAFVSHFAARAGGTPQVAARGICDLLSRRLLAPPDVTRLAEGFDLPLNTDRNRYFEYYTPRYNYSRENWLRLNLLRLSSVASFPAPFFAAGVPAAVTEACGKLAAPDYRRALGLGRQ
jgi:spermidine synthase